MRFLVDECTGPAVAVWLRGRNHEVFSIYEQDRGADDEAVIRRALKECWILITNDKDFGAKVYRDGRLHRGVILLRLSDERTANKILVLARLLDSYATLLAESFVVATETTARFARTQSRTRRGSGG